MQRRLALAVFGFTLALILATAGSAQTYSITDLGALGTHDTFAFGINDATRITGVSFVPANPGNIRHGFLWEEGQLTDLGTFFPGGYLWPTDINEAGHITGYGDTSAFGSPQPFIYRNGNLVNLMMPHDAGQPRGMNNLDQVTGFVFDTANPELLGFVWTPGSGHSYLPAFSVGGDAVGEAINDHEVVAGWSHPDPVAGCLTGPRAAVWTDPGGGAWVGEDLGVFGSFCHSHAWDINEIGQVVGDSGNFFGNSTAIKWQRNALGQWTMQDLGALGGNHATAYAINNRVQVVGKADGRAFLWQCGQMVDLNTKIPAGSGWFLISAQDINDLGEITGYGTRNGFSNFRSFVLKPSKYNTCCRTVIDVNPVPLTEEP